MQLLVERTDLGRRFPRYHDIFVGVIGAQAALAEADLEASLEEEGRIARIQRLLGPIAAQLPELQSKILTPPEKTHFLAFGEEVLRGIVELSKTSGLMPRVGASTNSFESLPIMLDDSAPNNWGIAQTYLYIIQSPSTRVDEACLDLDEIHQPGAGRKTDKPFDPWVWQFGLDVHTKDSGNFLGEKVYEGRSPHEWHRNLQREYRPVDGNMLFKMYQLADVLGKVQSNLIYPENAG